MGSRGRERSSDSGRVEGRWNVKPGGEGKSGGRKREIGTGGRGEAERQKRQPDGRDGEEMAGGRGRPPLSDQGKLRSFLSAESERSACDKSAQSAGENAQ